MFKIIYDKAVADELWQAGVLWWKYKAEGGRWRIDDTQKTAICAPSLTWASCDYAVQIEE